MDHGDLNSLEGEKTTLNQKISQWFSFWYKHIFFWHKNAVFGTWSKWKKHKMWLKKNTKCDWKCLTIYWLEINLSISSPYYGITNRQSYIRKVLSRYLHSPGSHQSTRFLEWLNDSLTHTITLSIKKMNQFISKLIVFVRWLEICGWITSKFCILICFDRHCAFSCGSLEG